MADAVASPARGSGGEGLRTLTAEAIAATVGGALHGDASAVVSGVAPLDRAQAHHLSFLANAKYSPLAEERTVGVLLVTPQLAESGHARARIVVDNPLEAMLPLLPLLYPPEQHEPGVHRTAVLGRGVVLGDDMSIGA